jgi:hypothetical protein
MARALPAGAPPPGAGGAASTAPPPRPPPRAQVRALTVCAAVVAVSGGATLLSNVGAAFVHVLAYGTLLGSIFFNTFVVGEWRLGFSVFFGGKGGPWPGVLAPGTARPCGGGLAGRVHCLPHFSRWSGGPQPRHSSPRRPYHV